MHGAPAHARLILWLILAGLFAAASAKISAAGSIVLANRTTERIVCQIGEQDCPIASGDVFVLRTDTSHTIRFPKSERPSYRIDPNAVYFLGPSSPSRVGLVRIGIGGDTGASSIFDSDLIDRGSSAAKRNRADGMATISVKLLVDDDEAATDEAWQRRLQARVKQASAIFERHCFVRFEVVAVDTWESDDEIVDFEQSFRDFERKVKPEPARLAIGFTSQYRIMLGRTHLGGTRGPMHTHMLVREWSNRISEPERLEVLVHELGHFLGAVHSPEPDSVMRAVLGDKRARAASFRIGFDPVNTLAMCFVGESLERDGIKKFAQMRLATQLELHKLYGEIARTDAHEKTPMQYVSLLESASITPLVNSTRQVLMGIDAAAKANDAVNVDQTDQEAPALQMSGDELTGMYVRRAAAVAHRLPASVGPRAFLLALGIGLDRTKALDEHRLIGPLTKRILPDAAENKRLAALGVPTIHGKHERARHFVLAAALSAVLGHEAAERACLALQLGHHDRRGGFNPAIYQADLAGIVFAYQVQAGEISLDALSRHFTVADHVPPCDQDETLSPEAFDQRYGSVADQRFRQLRQELAKPIRELAR